MLSENIKPNWKITLAKFGNPQVFGQDTFARFQMSPSTAKLHFEKIWCDCLEPLARVAEPITLSEAQARLEGKQRDFALPGFQYRAFVASGVPFVIRLDQNATQDGNMDQIWPARERSTLTIDFGSVPPKQRFDQLAKRLKRSPAELAAQLVEDFASKLDEPKSPGFSAGLAG